jgi:hypothetical protein
MIRRYLNCSLGHHEAISHIRPARPGGAISACVVQACGEGPRQRRRLHSFVRGQRFSGYTPQEPSTTSIPGALAGVVGRYRACNSGYLTSANRQRGASVSPHGTRQGLLANDAITKEYAESASRIELWKLFQGRFDALYLLLDNRRWPDSKGAPLSSEEIQWHEADFSNKLLDWFGDDYRTAYFKHLGDIPENVLAQSERLRSHSNLMHQQMAALIARSPFAAAARSPL